MVKLIKQLSNKHSTWSVFEDFQAMSALSISNSVDWLHRKKREEQYMEIVKKYDKSELDMFPQMLAYLVNEMEKYSEQPTDILGSIFHELELHNKYRGQFFTPQPVCDFMSEITAGDKIEMVDECDYKTVYEPCAGSGAMVLGFAKVMKKYGYDFQRQMLVTATDIDIKCVHMTYLQLSLYGIPAVVIHGNTLSMQEWSRWYTPIYMLNNWVGKQLYKTRNNTIKKT